MSFMLSLLRNNLLKSRVVKECCCILKFRIISVSFLPWAPVTDFVNFPKKTSKFEQYYYSTFIELPWVSVTKIGGWSTFRSCVASYSVTGKNGSERGPQTLVFREERAGHQ